jgi:hypothetical protein
MGLMADLDINTEHLRWMGDTRFLYGFLRGSAFIHLVHIVTRHTPLHFVVIRQRPCPIKISLKVSERDKLKMHENYQSAWHKQDEDRKTCWDDLHPSEKLPPLKHSETDTDGWEDFDIPVLYFYGGLMPYVSQYVSLLPMSRSLVLTFCQGPAPVATGDTERWLDRYRDPRNGFHVEFSRSDGRGSPWWPVLDQNGEWETLRSSRADRD